MPNLKISAMPGLGVNAAPGDLLTIVDVSAPAASANKHETLNNLLSVITRGITDKALRFQTPGTAPAVSLAAQGAIYFDGSNFQISANGGAYAPLLSLSPQADHAVLIGPTTGGPTAPTWRGLALSDLPAIATDRLLGRVSPGSGDVEEITPGSGILTWLTTPTLSNFLAAIQFIAGTTGTNNWVFSDSPTLTTPRISQINVNSNRAVLSFVQSGNSVNYLQISNSVNIPSSTYGGPTIETIGTGTDINLWLKSKGDGNIDLSPGVTGRVTVSSLDANNPGIIIARNGLLFGAQVVIGGVTLSAPLTASGFYLLPLTDGTSGQALVTDGAGTLSWATVSATPGGMDKELQWNNSGAFDGTSKVVYSPTSTVLTVTDTTGQTGLVCNTVGNDTNGSGPAIRYVHSIQPTINNTHAYNGANFQQEVALSNAQNIGTGQTAIFQFNHRGTGTVSSARGSLYQVVNRNTGIITDGQGMNVNVTNTSTGTITNGYGLFGSITAGSGTITNGYGVYISSNTATNKFGVFVNGSFTNVSNGGSTTWATSSDARYKTDVVNYELGLAQILQYRPVRFTWNEKSAAAGKRKVGLIAQEAQLVDPDLIFQLPADEYYSDPLAMDAENITWQLVKAVQELTARVVMLETMETT